VSSGADKQSQVHDELMVELRDAFLTVERKLIERGQLNTVRQTWLTFQERCSASFSMPSMASPAARCARRGSGESSSPRCGDRLAG
jgi:hypothetical protein